VLVPSKKVTSLGSAIFAFLAAGTFKTIEEAQKQICPSHTVFNPQKDTQGIYDELYSLYRRLYFDFGEGAGGGSFGDVLPALIRISSSQMSRAHTTEKAN